MNRYKIIDKATQQQVYEYEADSPIAWNTNDWGNFTLFDHVLVEPDAPPPPEAIYGGRRVLTKLEFLKLFTPQERVAIRQAATQNTTLDDFLYLLELSGDIDLDYSDTIQGVNLLEQAGIIGPGRASEVLNG